MAALFAAIILASLTWFAMDWGDLGGTLLLVWFQLPWFVKAAIDLVAFALYLGLICLHFGTFVVIGRAVERPTARRRRES
ncbi:MAG TPA: hypothetical protein VI076_03055 [Actinopolymorphaceae bacterium]